MTQQKPFILDNHNNSIQIPGMTLRRNAGLPTPSKNVETKRKAIVFVDANNWYHNVKKFFNKGAGWKV